MSKLTVTTEREPSGRWLARFSEHGYRFVGVGPDEHAAIDSLWVDRDEQLGIKPYEPPASWVHEDQLKDPVYMMNHQAEAAQAIRQGRVRYGAGLPGSPAEDRLG